MSKTSSNMICCGGGIFASMFLRSFVVATGMMMMSNGIAAGTNVSGSSLTPEFARITDRAIYRDQGVYRETQQRIKSLNDGGRRVADYQLSKAQCWLDVSFHEYSRNDRGGFPEAALKESQRILTALEEKADPGWETPLVNDAEKLRPDLWARYDNVKQDSGFQCAAQKTACAEVELVHAGNEIRDAGWRHAKPYVQIAEDLAGEAEKAAASCASIVPTKLVLSADALFKFDKSSQKDLLPKGKKELDEMAYLLHKAYPHVDALTVTGYTDRLGSKRYNQTLSEYRAQTVKTYLEERGVKIPIKAEGRGMDRQLVACESLPSRQALIDCLQPNRRVEITVHEKAKP